jgi:hypothetical protein
MRTVCNANGWCKMNIKTDQAAIPTNCYTAAPALEPLLVSTTTAKRVCDFGNTKFWALVKAGKIEMVDVGTGRRSVVYASLKKLVSTAQ